MEKRLCKLCQKYRVITRGVSRSLRKRPAILTGGKPWTAKICPDCNKKERLAIKRAIGFEKGDSYIRLRCVFSEKLIAEFFRAQGFEVKCEHKPGPDLVISKSGKKALTVEVKNLNRSNWNSFSLQRIGSKRENDDLIAVVFPDMTFQVLTMAEFKKQKPKVFYKTIRY